MKATNVVRFAFHAVAVGAKLIDLIRYKTKPMIILPAQPGSRKICRTHCVRFHLMTRARENVPTDTVLVNGAARLIAWLAARNATRSP